VKLRIRATFFALVKAMLDLVENRSELVIEAARKKDKAAYRQS
jgi:hypothetical protein